LKHGATMKNIYNLIVTRDLKRHATPLTQTCSLTM